MHASRSRCNPRSCRPERSGAFSMRDRVCGFPVARPGLEPGTPRFQSCGGMCKQRVGWLDPSDACNGCDRGSEWARRPIAASFGAAVLYRGFKHWFVSYAFLPRYRTRPAGGGPLLDRQGPLPPSAALPASGCPSASPDRYGDGAAHPNPVIWRLVAQARLGRFGAVVSASGARAGGCPFDAARERIRGGAPRAHGPEAPWRFSGAFNVP